MLLPPARRPPSAFTFTTLPRLPYGCRRVCSVRRLPPSLPRRPVRSFPRCTDAPSLLPTSPRRPFLPSPTDTDRPR